MDDTPTTPSPSADELPALRAIVEGTAGHTGQAFFESLVRHLAAAVATSYAFVAVFTAGTRARTLAFWCRDRIGDNVEWDVVGTPCEDVVRGRLCHYPDGVTRRFPKDKISADRGIESYLGVPLRDAQGRHLGHLAVFDERPMPAEPRNLFTFRIFAARAAAELERLQYEVRLRESEQRSRSLTEELRQVNARLELAVRGSNLAIWEYDMPDGRLENARATFINGAESLGYDPSTVPTDYASMLSAIVPPDDRERLWREVQEFLDSERPVFETEARVRHKDGSDRWHLRRGVASRDAEGKPVRFIGSSVDITDLKRAQEALRENEGQLRRANERLELAVRGSDICIWDIDMPDGDFRHRRGYFVNMWESLGYERSDSLSDVETTRLLVHPDDLAPFEEAARRYLAGETSKFEAENRDRHKDGSYRWRMSRGVAVRDAGGKPIRFVGTGIDITDRKRLEAELRQAKEAAEAANRAKDEFLANVSHEIRTPMNAILGMTELVLDAPLADDQRQCLRTVKSAADNLLSILNDLLDFSKIEAGKLELDLGDFSLRSAVGSTLRALASRAHRKGLELVCNVQPDVPDALIGDAGRLRQVLLNLVGNAIKFTEEGEVVVQVEAEPVAEPAGRQEVVLRFSVCDTGIGIPPDNQERIFRAFEQDDTSTTRKYGGTGLGLTIAARLVALMGGQISVSSAPGQGSTFVFTARFALEPHSAEPTASQTPVLLRKLPVLIIDDNATNRQILLEWLRGWQMDPAAAGDGVAAMDALWEAATQGRPYALVLLDARMPDTDGLALATQIRKRAELSATRIILLSSGDRPGDWDRVRQLRIDAHLLKPIQQDELLDRIYQVMSRAKGDEPAEAGPAAGRELPPVPTPAATPLHILVAEDDEFSAQFLEQLLARRGHRVRLTTNGREALSLAVEGLFDFLLLDIHMPELDGFGVVGAIREREGATGGHLPIIALTARSRIEDRERCLAAGMDDFVTKPVAATALDAAIERLIRRNEGSGPRAERSLQDSSIPHSSTGRLLDADAVLTASGEDTEGLRRLCQDFQTYAPSRLTEIAEALQSRDAPRLSQAAHKLSALLFVFSTVAGNVASDLEDFADEGRLDDAKPLVERLETMTWELMCLVDNLSVDALRDQARAADDSDRAIEP